MTKGTCGCGRSPTGNCIGWHGLSKEVYEQKLAEYKNQVEVTPEEDEAWKELAKRKKLSRLFAFGCSFTYGHGLDDCWIDNNRPGYVHSKLAWPDHLGSLLDREVLNLSEPGCSNQEMLRRILSTSYKQDDVVIILWTHYSRDVIYVEKGFPGSNTDEHNVSYLPIASWQVGDRSNSYFDQVKSIVNNYYMAHGDIDQVMRKWLTIHHAETHLNYLGIKNYSFFVNSRTDLDDKLDFLDFKNLQTTYLYDIMFVNNELALDGQHPGKQAHKEMAEKMFEIISKPQ